MICDARLMLTGWVSSCCSYDAEIVADTSYHAVSYQLANAISTSLLQDECWWEQEVTSDQSGCEVSFERMHHTSGHRSSSICCSFLTDRTPLLDAVYDIADMAPATAPEQLLLTSAAIHASM